METDYEQENKNLIRIIEEMHQDRRLTIATAAMQGMLSNPYTLKALYNSYKAGDQPIKDFIAELAVNHANALIKELEKGK